MYSAAVVQEVLQWRLRAWKMRSVVASYRKLTMPNWETLLKLILLQLHEKLLKNATLTILWSFGIWSKLERWKSSISGCLMCWSKSRKLLKCHFFLLLTTTNHFSISLRNEKWILYDSRYVQLSGWTEKKLQSTFQSQCCTEKDHGHCLVLCCWSVPLQLSES